MTNKVLAVWQTKSNNVCRSILILRSLVSNFDVFYVLIVSSGHWTSYNLAPLKNLFASRDKFKVLEVIDVGTCLMMEGEWFVISVDVQ